MRMVHRFALQGEPTRNFSTYHNLIAHQKTAKYCLELRGKEAIKNFKCDHCDYTTTARGSLAKHKLTCSVRNFTENEKALDNDSNEIWKSLDSLGYPNYEISSLGRLKNLRTKLYGK